MPVNSEAATKAKEEARAARREKNRKVSAWSDKVTRQEVRDARKEKRKRKKAWLKNAGTQPPSAEGEKEEGSDGGEAEDDWDELANEERMAKKARAGKVDVDNMFASL